MHDRLRRTYKKWFWNTYDHVGTLIVANVLWVLCAAPVFTLPASTAGLFRVTSRIAAYQDVGVREFFIGFRTHFWPSVRLCGFYFVCLTVLLVNGLFYNRLMDDWPWISAILSGGMLWAILFVGLTGMVTFPLLVQTHDPVRVIIKKGVALVLDNIVFTGVVFISGLGVLILGAVTGAGLLIGAVSAIGVLFSTGFRELEKKYSPYSDVQDVSTSTDADQDLEEPRGWRDLFRPWDY